MLKRLLVFAALIAACVPAPAQTPGPPLQLQRGSLHISECKAPDCVMVGAEGLADLITTNGRMGLRIGELEAEVAKLKEIKGCGRLTVVPKGTSWKGV